MNYPYDELGSGIDRIFVQTLNKNFDEVEEDIQNLYNPVKSIIEGAFDDAALVANFESLLRDEVDRLEPSIQEFKTETDNKFAGVTAQLAEKITKFVLDDIPENLSSYDEGSLLFISQNAVNDLFWSDDFEVIDRTKWNVDESTSGLITVSEGLVFNTNNAFEHKALFSAKQGIYTAISGVVTMRVQTFNPPPVQSLVEFYYQPYADLSNVGSDLSCSVTQYGDFIKIRVIDKNNVAMFWSELTGWESVDKSTDLAVNTLDVLFIKVTFDVESDSLTILINNETTGVTVVTSPFAMSNLSTSKLYWYPHIIDSSLTQTKRMTWSDFDYRGDV